MVMGLLSPRGSQITTTKVAGTGYAMIMTREQCFLVLPLLKCLVTGIPSLIGSSWEKEYPSLITRDYHGLSWDTPAGYKLLKVVPAVMGRWEFVNVQL